MSIPIRVCINITNIIRIMEQDELTNIQAKYDKQAKYCRVCGKSICYRNTKASVVNGRVVYGGTTYKTTKKIGGKCFSLTVCEHCMCEKYDDFSKRNVSRIFNTCNKYVSYGFDVPFELIESANKDKALTIDNFIKRYGDIDGRKRFDEYRNKQAFTNSFEYKREKYGWSYDDYEAYNKSRSVTLENMIKKYGNERGSEIYNAYVERQRLTKSKEYVIEKYGYDYWDSLCKSKAITVENYINKYGEDEGIKRYKDVIDAHPKFVSKMATDFFQKLVDENKSVFDGLKLFFGNKNEFGLYDKESKQYYFIDFFVYDINVAVEFNENYFHANPSMYAADFSDFWHTDKSALEIWKTDELKHNAIKKRGIDLFVVWESDKDNENLKNDIINFIIKKRYELGI